MTYSESKARYSKFKSNMLKAERDLMSGNLMSGNIIKTKSMDIKKKSSHIKMTPKRIKVLFVREYLKGVKKVSATGLARKHENIYKNTRKKPDKQLVKDFKVILNDLVNLGILKKRGFIRSVPYYEKIINPNKSH